MSNKVVHITTVPETLSFFRGHVDYAQKQGFEVSAISSRGDKLTAFGESQSVQTYAVEMPRQIAPVHDLKALLGLIRILRRIRPAIVHSHTPKAGLLGTIAARAAGVPVVVVSIFGLPQMTKGGVQKKILDLTTKLSVKLSNLVWCDSPSLRDHVIQTGLCPAHKVVTLGHGSVAGVDAKTTFAPDVFEYDIRESVREKWGIPSNALVVGFVGRLTKDKGLGELAESWRQLAVNRPNTHLLLVGPFESGDPIALEDRQLFESDARVHLTGRQANVAELMACMDVFVLPSHREGFGMTNIEAAAMGLPVASTRIPGCVDSVQDGVTGTLVPARDADALREAIERYLDNPALRQQHGKAGRERVLRDFRPESIWEAMYQEYCSLLRAKGLVLPQFAGEGSRGEDSK